MVVFSDKTKYINFNFVRCIVKTRNTVVVLSILLCCFTTSLFAQSTGNISGTVVNNETGEPLPRANILLEEIQTRTVAGPDGSFAFSNIETGNYIISVSHVGFRLKKVKINLNNNYSPIEIRLFPRIEQLQEVVVTPTRAKKRETPVAFSNFTKEEIEERYRAQDVPFFLTEMPGVNAFSMNGNGIGYSEITIRGFDQRRVAMMINGIPQNDPESHSVYWIDLPDILESVEDVQVQRGVGSSLYGGYGIGGVINLITDSYSQEKDFYAKASFGSYNTRKFTMSLNSGLIDNSWTTNARFSKITSNGYRDRSWVDLWSYFISLSRYDVSMTTRLNLYGGPEKTHFAFFGATKEELDNNRKSNPSVFPDDTDNFNQPHYELINEWNINENMSLSNTFFYIKGDGFFQFRDYKPFDYLEDVVQKDLLDLKQYGWLPRFEIGHKQGTFNIGGELRYNNARHWKEIIARFDGGTALINGQYEVPYDYRAKKIMVTLYANESYQISPKLTAMAGFQFMYHNYKVDEDPIRNVNFDENYSFLTPRFGLNYNVDDNFNIFGNFSMARREPALFDLWDPSGVFNYPTATPESFRNIDLARNIWKDPVIEPEELTDWELGIGYQKPNFQANVNAYIMDFRNEIVNSGYLGASGLPLRNNSAETMHRGLEFELDYKPTDIFQFSSNLSLSENYFRETYDFSGNSISVTDNTIANFPGIMTNSRITGRHHGARVSLAVRYVGKQYLDNTESEERIVNAYTLGTLSFGYDITSIPDLGNLQLSLDIYNLFDDEYESFGHINFFGEPAWIPGADRNFMFTIKTVF
jgi:iron complex outermembrane receptor protein